MKCYDYIIIGYGPTSSTLSYILARDPNISVLLIELGTNELDNELVLNPYGVFIAQNFPNICETLNTNSNPQSFGTRFQLYRGSTWGGGSSVNYQVYDRGSRSNWNVLKTFNEVFDYDYLVDAFWTKVENYNCSKEMVVDNLHGFDGNYYQHISITTPLTQPLASGFYEILKIPFTSDSNGRIENGTFQITENQNVRCTSEDIFQRSTFTLGYTNKLDSNILIIKSGCLVDKIDIDLCTKKAKGVYYITSKGCYQYAKARKAVILGAGALSSPCILQRSGIGPYNLLESLNIPLVLNNTNVGSNLSIQYGFTAVFIINKKVYDEIIGGPDNYLQTSITAYFSTNEIPRQCYIHILSAAILTSQPALQAQIEGLYDPEEYGAVTALCWDLFPKTKGSVKITSPAPFVPADIQFDTYTDPDDLAVGRFMLLTLQKVINTLSTTPSGEMIDAKLIYPSPSVLESEDEMNTFLRSTTYIAYHYFQTCRISNSPIDGVVDKNLHVHGIQNLIVSDGSVLIDKSLGAGPSGQLTALGYSTATIIKQIYGNGNLII